MNSVYGCLEWGKCNYGKTLKNAFRSFTTNSRWLQGIFWYFTFLCNNWMRGKLVDTTQWHANSESIDRYTINLQDNGKNRKDKRKPLFGASFSLININLFTQHFVQGILMICIWLIKYNCVNYTQKWILASSPMTISLIKFHLYHILCVLTYSKPFFFSTPISISIKLYELKLKCGIKNTSNNNIISEKSTNINFDLI